MNSEFENTETTVDAVLHSQNPKPNVVSVSADVASAPSRRKKTPSKELPKELPALTNDDRDDFTKLDKRVRAGVRVPLKTGRCLLEIKERNLYRAKHRFWKHYCASHEELSPEHANRLIRAAKHALAIETAGKNKRHPWNLFPTVEWQIRPLYKLGDLDAVIEAWRRAIEIAKGPPTGGQVQQAVDEILESNPGAAKKQTDKKMEYRRIVDALADCIRLQDSWKKAAEFVSELRAKLKLPEIHD